jgi:hypothetical protein
MNLTLIVVGAILIICIKTVNLHNTQKEQKICPVCK